MRNEGNSNWPNGCQLTYVGGDLLTTQNSVAVSSVKPGEEIDISVDMITPVKAGRYTSFWRLTAPEGTKFGHRIWVDLVVVNDESPKQTSQTPVIVAQQQPAPVVQQLYPSLPVVQQQIPVVIQPSPVVQKASPVPVREQKPVVQPVLHVPAPSAPAQEPDAVEQIVAMGFSDRELIRAVLDANNQDLPSAVAVLLNL